MGIWFCEPRFRFLFFVCSFWPVHEGCLNMEGTVYDKILHELCSLQFP